MPRCCAEQKSLILKTILYRSLALSVTILTVYIFTQEIKIASGIGITDFIVKTINYYIYEAVWNRVRWGKINDQDTRLRSFVKAVILRLEASSLTLLISYIFLRTIVISVWIALAETAEKIVLYYLFERAWLKLKICTGTVRVTEGEAEGVLRRHCGSLCQQYTDLP